MHFNFLTYIKTCFDLVRDTVDVGFIYYSHIPIALVSLFIGVYVYFKNKNLLSKIFLSMSVTLSMWVVCSLITWTSYNSISYMFFWSFFGTLTAIIFILSFYFAYVFINNHDVHYFTKLIWSLLLIPILLISPTTYNLSSFDGVWCIPTENNIFNYYYYFFGIIVFIGILIIFIKKNKEKTSNKKQSILFIIGIESFVLMFFVACFLASYLVDNGYLTNFNIEPYGLFGMVIFMSFLAYLIVKFKIFSIKLIGAQALVWSSVILIGSQFFYLQGSSLTVKILTAITLIITGVLGYILVRGVKKEIALKEKLEVANAGQKNLIHIMNHQIKGYLGDTKNIFAELLTDDYGKVPEEAKDLITKGLETSDGGVKYVNDILRGDSAESGSLNFDMKSVDFKEIVSGVLEKIKGAIEKKGLKLSVDIANGACNILGDSTQLSEAVRNLIENSMHYTPSGEIWIRLKQTGGKVILSVKDTGVGIKAEDKDKLFKAGGVGSESIKINVNSSGYGLAFVKGVIEKHNGKVWFESAGAGKGSTFFVELPIN